MSKQEGAYQAFQVRNWVYRQRCPLKVPAARDSAGIVCTSFSISSPRGGGTEIFYSSWHTITGAQRGRELVMIYLDWSKLPAQLDQHLTLQHFLDIRHPHSTRPVCGAVKCGGCITACRCEG